MFANSACILDIYSSSKAAAPTDKALKVYLYKKKIDRFIGLSLL
ncbi:hypothetical protein MASR2M64_12550 [Candidatus Cloacimonadota bacterium]